MKKIIYFTEKTKNNFAIFKKSCNFANINFTKIVKI